MRISIDKTHEKYLQFLASEIDATPKEVLNFLIWKLRESKYTFGGQIPLQSPTQPHRLENPYFDPSTFESTPKTIRVGFVPQSPQAIQDFENLRDEIDPIIARMASLIEDF
jgi:hypothetical protein